MYIMFKEVFLNTFERDGFGGLVQLQRIEPIQYFFFISGLNDLYFM